MSVQIEGYHGHDTATENFDFGNTDDNILIESFGHYSRNTGILEQHNRMTPNNYTKETTKVSHEQNTKEITICCIQGCKLVTGWQLVLDSGLSLPCCISNPELDRVVDVPTPKERLFIAESWISTPRKSLNSTIGWLSSYAEKDHSRFCTV